MCYFSHVVFRELLNDKVISLHIERHTCSLGLTGYRKDASFLIYSCDKLTFLKHLARLTVNTIYLFKKKKKKEIFLPTYFFFSFFFLLFLKHVTGNHFFFVWSTKQKVCSSEY